MDKNYVSHLECSITGKKYEANKIYGLSDAGRPLLVKYDLQTLKKEVSRDDITNSKVDGLWRYSPFLPVLDPNDWVTLGETITPLIKLNRTVNYSSKDNGVVLVKDEGRLPTGSFKARGLCMAVSMAKQFKLKHLAIPTNGNAGAAMAAYATNAGIKSTVFCPEDTPDINIREIQSLGAETFLVNGLINDCGKIVGEGKQKVGWFDVSTLKEPYRIEGKKTMGLELAEQLNWELPDVIFYPTGGGTGLIGMWKAFLELKELGWINGKLPKMVAVQATGCAPIVKAWENGDEHAPLWENAYTKAAGIRVPIAVGDFLIIRAIRESKGFAMSVSDEEIFEARERVASNDGCFLCPEGAATMSAFEKALSSKFISKDDKVVLFNCATGLKYPLPEVSNKIDKDKEIDYKIFINSP